MQRANVSRLNLIATRLKLTATKLANRLLAQFNCKQAKTLIKYISWTLVKIMRAACGVDYTYILFRIFIGEATYWAE